MEKSCFAVFLLRPKLTDAPPKAGQERKFDGRNNPAECAKNFGMPKFLCSVYEAG